MPAASKIDRSRYAVVVLPLVPVMPTTWSDPLGWPDTRSASTASARRASGTTTHGTLKPPGSGASATTATAPRATACAANCVPSLFWPRSATNTEPFVARLESYATSLTGASPAGAGM